MGSANEGDRPLCKCHGEPMIRAGYRKNGAQLFRCRVKRRHNSVKYREANKDKIRQRDARYRETNREKIRQYLGQYREANKDKIRQQKAGYRETNREKVCEQHRKYRARKKKQGLCARCGKNDVFLSSTICSVCRRKQQKYRFEKAERECPLPPLPETARLKPLPCRD